MWARVDDEFDEHKKVFIAGDRLGGPNATGRILAVWLEGRLWTNRHNTLGFLPATVVRRFKHDEDPLAVAKALSDPLTDEERLTWNTDSVNCLWVEAPGGYRLHDDEHYRPKKDPATVSEARSASGRLGGQRSAEKRAAQQTSKQIASPDGKQTEQTPKQIASGCLDENSEKAPPTDVGGEANSKQPPKQNSNPVSRIPDPGTPRSQDTHTHRGRGGTLITPPAKQANVRFFSQIGLNVPNFLHNDEFVPRLVNGGLSAQQAEAQLEAWYLATEEQYRGRQVGDTPVEFWRKRFTEWLGKTGVNAQVKCGTAAPSTEDLLAQKNRETYGGMRWGQ